MNNVVDDLLSVVCVIDLLEVCCTVVVPVSCAPL
jgi:hypothetical protein